MFLYLILAKFHVSYKIRVIWHYSNKRINRKEEKSNIIMYLRNPGIKYYRILFITLCERGKNLNLNIFA